MFVLMNNYAQQAAEILSYREREPALPIVRSWSLRPVPGMRFRLSSGQSPFKNHHNRLKTHLGIFFLPKLPTSTVNCCQQCHCQRALTFYMDSTYSSLTITN